MSRKQKTQFENEMIFCYKRLEQYADKIIDKYKYRQNNKKYKRMIVTLDRWEQMIHIIMQENKNNNT